MVLKKERRLENKNNVLQMKPSQNATNGTFYGFPH